MGADELGERRRARGQVRRGQPARVDVLESLAALLHEPADELLGVGLEDAVDLVEHAVDVGVEVLLAGARLRRCGGGLRAPSSGPSSRRCGRLCSWLGMSWPLARGGLADPCEPIPMPRRAHAAGWRRPGCGRAARPRAPWCPRSGSSIGTRWSERAARGRRRSPSPTTRRRSGRGTSRRHLPRNQARVSCGRLVHGLEDGVLGDQLLEPAGGARACGTAPCPGARRTTGCRWRAAAGRPSRGRRART